jgi:hypothetical protein
MTSLQLDILCSVLFRGLVIGLLSEVISKSHKKRCTIPGCQVVVATKSCRATPIICGRSIWTLLRVTFLKPKKRWPLEFIGKICTLLT